MRRTYLIAVVAFGIVLALVLAAWRTLDVNRYRASLQNRLADQFGRNVSLGLMHPTLVPFGVRVDGVTIAEDSSFARGRPFARAEGLDVRLQPFALLLGRVNLRSVTLRRPSIELIRDAEGRWNFATLLSRNRGRSDFFVERLTIDDGEIAVTGLPRPRVVYRNVNLGVRRFTPDRPFDVDLAITLPDHAAQRLRLSGRVGPLVSDDFAQTAFDGVMNVDHVVLSTLRRFLDLPALEDSDALVSGEATLRRDHRQAFSKGELRFEQPRARGRDLGYPIAIAFDITHSTVDDILTIGSATLRLDKTPLSIAGRIDLRPEIPILDVHATASDVSLAEAARLASAFGVAFGADARVQGRLAGDLRARGPANRPACDGQVQLRDVSISRAGVAYPVRTSALNLSLSANEIRSNDFSASTNGTQLSGRFGITAYQTEKPLIDGSVRTTDAHLDDALNIVRAWGIKTPDDISGTGRLTLNLRVTGDLHEPAFSGSGTLNEATLRTTATAQPVRIRHADLTFSGNSAAAQNVDATIGRTNAQGRVAVNAFANPRLEFDVTADKVDVDEVRRVFAPQAARPAEQQRRGVDSVLLRVSGYGRLRAGAITYGQLVLDNVQTNATLDHGLIRLDPLTAGLFGGSHRGSIALDARRTPPGFLVASNLQRVDANRLATAMADVRDMIHGQLASIVRVTFAGGANVAPTLNGTFSINLPNGRIAGVNVLREVGLIAQFLGGPTAGNSSTSVTALSGNFRVTDGVAYTNDLLATIEGGRVGAAGSINLVNLGLKLRMNVVLSRTFSRNVGGTHVGGFMGTVLANQQGELVVPVLVTGTLRRPLFAPDAQGLAEMQVRNLVPSLGDPQGLATGLLGILGGQPEPTTGEKGFSDVLGTLTGQRPQDQRPKPPTAKPQPKARDQELEDTVRNLLGGKEKTKKPPRQ